jgi:hypothetical protein
MFECAAFVSAGSFDLLADVVAELQAAIANSTSVRLVAAHVAFQPFKVLSSGLEPGKTLLS